MDPEDYFFQYTSESKRISSQIWIGARKNQRIGLEMVELVELGNGIGVGGGECVGVDGGVIAPGGLGVALWGDPLEIVPRLRLHLRGLLRRQVGVAPSRPLHLSLHLSQSPALDRYRRK